MTKKQFERKHPGLIVTVGQEKRGPWAAFATKDGELVAMCVSYKPKTIIDKLSGYVYSLESRKVMAEQGGRDANTGQHGPLQAHHVKHRARGGTHAKENLAAVSPDTHRKFHEEK